MQPEQSPEVEDGNEGQRSEEDAEKKTDLHRIFGLTLAVLLWRLGYSTEVEADLSFQRQIIDLICVCREKVIDPSLPSIYWQAFDDLNEHNLISFKSY